MGYKDNKSFLHIQYFQRTTVEHTRKRAAYCPRGRHITDHNEKSAAIVLFFGDCCESFAYIVTSSLGLGWCFGCVFPLAAASFSAVGLWGIFGCFAQLFGYG